MLPEIELTGTPFEQGLHHGRRAQKLIEHNLDIYFERFLREGRVTHEEVLRRATAYWQAIQAESSAYAEALRGVAEGSGCGLPELVALNVRYEILYHQFTANALADGCTTLAVLPEASADGHLYLGENWDWIPEVRGLLLRIREGDLSVLCFTEAGIVGGKIGLNSEGVGLAINGLISTDDDWARLRKPFHVRCYEILRARTLKEAQAIVTNGDRSCSANFLLAGANDGAVDTEAAPLRTRALHPQNGLLVHTNHFLDPAALGVQEPPNEREEYSIHRLERSRALLDTKRPLAAQDVMACLRDHEWHPNGICRHPEETQPPHERYQTVVSVIMDLHERAMWISEGPPCEAPYGEAHLQD